jgi:NAD(P)-dependent dehydrogenase (short-subunit alcohol dehydrogenase family)
MVARRREDGMGRLRDKVALITGAASGIGAACATRFAREGASIAALDLQEPVEPAAWSAVERAAPAVLFRGGLDVRDEAEVAAAISAVAKRFGRIDILVNAAGVGGGTFAHELEEADWNRIVDINLKGCFLVTKHVLSVMRAHGSGSIVNVASAEGLEGSATSVAYNASKAGVVVMTKNLAINYARDGIRVNCVCPGLIDTPLTAALEQPELEHVRNQILSWHAMDRSGRPEEVAAAVLFLASDDASFVTGHPLAVDGGWLAGRRLEYER